MGEGWDSLVEIRRAQAPKMKITQESPQGGDELLSTFRPAVAGSLEHELPNLDCLPTAGVRTQAFDQSGSAAGIQAEGGLSDTTVLSEPFTKRDDQFRLWSVSARAAGRLANPGLDQITVKPLRPELGMVVVTSLPRQRAMTTGQMAGESVERA